MTLSISSLLAVWNWEVFLVSSLLVFCYFALMISLLKYSLIYWGVIFLVLGLALTAIIVAYLFGSGVIIL